MNVVQCSHYLSFDIFHIYILERDNYVGRYRFCEWLKSNSLPGNRCRSQQAPLPRRHSLHSPQTGSVIRYGMTWSTFGLRTRNSDTREPTIAYATLKYAYHRMYGSIASQNCNMSCSTTSPNSTRQHERMATKRSWLTFTCIVTKLQLHFYPVVLDRKRNSIYVPRYQQIYLSANQNSGHKQEVT